MDVPKRNLWGAWEKELPYRNIGEKTMANVYDLPDIATVASATENQVFKDANDFVSELMELLSHPAKSVSS